MISELFTHPDFFKKLSLRLSQPLPGFSAHRKMINAERWNDYEAIKPNEKTRRSAVLILFYPAGHRWFMPMILRQAYEGVHSGQVGFPGGKQEDFDKNLTETALREANEEIGLDKNSVHVLGNLSEIFVFASNFMLLPIVAFATHKPDFLLDSREVAKLLEIPVTSLFEGNSVKETTVHLHNNLSMRVPYYDLLDQTVWGASAMVISELIAVIEQI